jgi:hypothetical protein
MPLLLLVSTVSTAPKNSASRSSTSSASGLPSTSVSLSPSSSWAALPVPANRSAGDQLERKVGRLWVRPLRGARPVYVITLLNGCVRVGVYERQRLGMWVQHTATLNSLHFLATTITNSPWTLGPRTPLLNTQSFFISPRQATLPANALAPSICSWESARGTNREICGEICGMFLRGQEPVTGKGPEIHMDGLRRWRRLKFVRLVCNFRKHGQLRRRTGECERESG